MTEREKAIEQEKAIDHLRRILRPGDTLYCQLRHVSRSGMYRAIAIYWVNEERVPINVSWSVAFAGGFRFDRNWGAVGIGGAGMDMGFAIVYGLSCALFHGGFGCVGKTDRGYCPSNDHSNGDRDYRPHNTGLQGKGHWHKDGGYALRYAWM